MLRTFRLLNILLDQFVHLAFMLHGFLFMGAAFMCCTAFIFKFRQIFMYKLRDLQISLQELAEAIVMKITVVANLGLVKWTETSTYFHHGKTSSNEMQVELVFNLQSAFITYSSTSS